MYSTYHLSKEKRFLFYFILWINWSIVDIYVRLCGKIASSEM